MNLQLLPKEIQIVIDEFNVEHRPKMRVVLEDLLRIFNYNVYCKYCCCRNNNKNTIKFIFGKQFWFCSRWCQFHEDLYNYNKEHCPRFYYS